MDQRIAAFQKSVDKKHHITAIRTLKLVHICTFLNEGGKEVKIRQRVGTYLDDLAYENRGVVGRLYEDSPRDDFTVVESLSTQACFSQAACIDQLEHLVRDK